MTLPRWSMMVAASVLSFPTMAADPESKGSVVFEVGAGAEYDSNLSLEEVDRVAGESDVAALFEARLGGEYRATERLTLTADYDFSSRQYRHQDQFDLDIHTLSADAGYHIDAVTLGASHHFSHARLASEGFLDLAQTSLYLSKLFDNDVFIRTAISDKRKRFDDNRERDAEGTGLTATLFQFFNDGRSFVSIGGRLDTENARADRFDNDARQARVRASNRFRLGEHSHRIQLGWRYLERQYEREMGLLGENGRHDRQRILDASWAVDLNTLLTLKSTVEAGHYESSLERADYNEQRVSVMLKARF